MSTQQGAPNGVLSRVGKMVPPKISTQLEHRPTSKSRACSHRTSTECSQMRYRPTPLVRRPRGRSGMVEVRRHGRRARHRERAPDQHRHHQGGDHQMSEPAPHARARGHGWFDLSHDGGASSVEGCRHVLLVLRTSRTGRLLNASPAPRDFRRSTGVSRTGETRSRSKKVATPPQDRWEDSSASPAYPRGPLVLLDDVLEQSGDRHRQQNCDDAAEEPARDAYQRTTVTVTEKSRLGGRHSG